MSSSIAKSIRAARSTLTSIRASFPSRSVSSTSSRSPLSRYSNPKSSVTDYARAIAPALIRFNQIRCRVNRHGSNYSPLNSSGGNGPRPPTEMEPLFPGCDYEHWLIVMDKPGGEGASKEQMIDCYIHTLAKVLGR